MTENNKQNEHNENNETKKKVDVEDEISSLRKEMEEMKKMLKAKKSRDEHKDDFEDEDEHDAHFGDHTDRHFRVNTSGNYEDIGDTIGSYLDNVMSGVAKTIEQSMEQMTKGFTFTKLERDMEKMGRKMEKMGSKLEKKYKNKFSGVKVRSLSAEELGDFFGIAPNLMTALADEKKLKLLKALENGAMYQKDLSEETEIKGGTFKHHMDSLLEMMYVYQETTRGRYLITQLGVEAIKLTEILFRRYMDIRDKEIRVEDDLDDDFDETDGSDQENGEEET